MKTTPPPKFDVTEKLPLLGEGRRTAIRLHPRQAPSPLPATASKMGWPFVWPEEEPWPACMSKMTPAQIAGYEVSLAKSRDRTRSAELAELIGSDAEQMGAIAQQHEKDSETSAPEYRRINRALVCAVEAQSRCFSKPNRGPGEARADTGSPLRERQRPEKLW